MMKSAKKTTAFMIAVCILLFSCPFSASSAKVQDENDFKIVFAIDTSGSMVDSDQDKLRLDAVGLFLGLLPEQQGMAGCLTFNTDAVSTAPLQTVSGKAAKEHILKTIENSPVRGDTAIAVALRRSLDMLDIKEGEAEPHACVILLTDGKDDYIGSGYTKKEYNKIRSDALESAKESGVTVLTVAIDTDGDSDIGDLDSLASDEECSFQVSDSEDLKQIFKKLYEKCFSSCSVKDSSVSKGKNSVSFFIPRAGITDTNIILSSEEALNSSPISRIEIENGGGSTSIEGKELSKYTLKSRTASVTKLPGEYTGACTVYLNSGISADELNVVYNDCLSAGLVGVTKEYSIGKDVGINARLYHHGEAVIGDGYDDYTATAQIVSPPEGSDPKMSVLYQMSKRDDQRYFASIPGSCFDIAKYKVSITVECKYTDKSVTTEAADLNIVNHAPLFTGNSVTVNYPNDDYVLIDLSGIVRDPDGDPLQLESPGNQIVIENGRQMLRIKIPKSKDSICAVITAQDPHQARGTIFFYVRRRYIPSKPGGTVWWILLGAVAVIAGLIILKALYNFISKSPRYTIEIWTDKKPVKSRGIYKFFPVIPFFFFPGFHSGISGFSRFCYENGGVVLKSRKKLNDHEKGDLRDHIEFKPRVKKQISAADSFVKLTVIVTER